MTQLFAQPPQKREAHGIRIFFGVFILFLVGTTPLFRTGPLADVLGRLFGGLTIAGPAVWLIVSGLPKTLGLDAAQRRRRRRIWYQSVGFGFIIMVALVSLLAYIGWNAAARLVAFVFWIGWTWVSWILADTKAIKSKLRDRRST